MADELFGLTQSQVSRLRAMLDAYDGGMLPRPMPARRTPLRSSSIVVGLLTDPIAATTALTSKPKVGSLNVYSFTSTGTEDTGFDETVYSFAPHIATTDRWTVAERDTFTGKFILTTQYCS